MSFHSKQPAVQKPDPLPNPPTMADSAVSAAQARPLSMIGGIQSTIKTSPQGTLKPASVGFKSLLGE